jgi:hypothetical protein
MKQAKTGWIVSATLRKSPLALERSGPGAGQQMVQAQNVIIAGNFMEAIIEFMKSISKDMAVMAISLNQIPVVEAEDDKANPPA